MDILVKCKLDALHEKSVTVLTQKYIMLEGVETSVGDQHARAYINSTEGRKELERDLQEPYLSAVLSVWGTEPVL